MDKIPPRRPLVETKPVQDPPAAPKAAPTEHNPDGFEKRPAPAKTLKDKYEDRFKLIEGLGRERGMELCEKEIRDADQIADPKEREMRLSLAHLVLANARRDPKNSDEFLFHIQHLSMAMEGISAERPPEWMIPERLFRAYHLQLKAGHSLLLDGFRFGQPDQEMAFQVNQQAELLARLHLPEFKAFRTAQVDEAILPCALELSKHAKMLTPSNARIIFSTYLDAIETGQTDKLSNPEKDEKARFTRIASQAMTLPMSSAAAQALIEQIVPNLDKILAWAQEKSADDTSPNFVGALGPLLYSHADFKTAESVFSKLAEYYEKKDQKDLLFMLYASVAFCARNLNDPKKQKIYETKQKKLLKTFTPLERREKESALKAILLEIPKRREAVRAEALREAKANQVTKPATSVLSSSYVAPQVPTTRRASSKTLGEQYEARLNILANFSPEVSRGLCEKEIRDAHQIADPEERKMRLTLAHLALAKFSLPPKTTEALIYLSDHLSKAMEGISPSNPPEWLTTNRLFQAYFMQMNAGYNFLLGYRSQPPTEKDRTAKVNTLFQVLRDLRSPQFAEFRPSINNDLLKCALELSNHTILTQENSRLIFSIYMDAAESSEISKVSDSISLQKKHLTRIASHAMTLPMRSAAAQELIGRLGLNLEKHLTLIEYEEGEETKGDTFLGRLNPLLVSHADWKTAVSLYERLVAFYEKKGQATLLPTFYAILAYCAKESQEPSKQKSYEAKTKEALAKLPADASKKTQTLLKDILAKIPQSRKSARLYEEQQAKADRPAAAASAPIIRVKNVKELLQFLDSGALETLVAAPAAQVAKQAKPVAKAPPPSVLSSTYVAPPEATAVRPLTKAERDELASQESKKRGPAKAPEASKPQEPIGATEPTSAAPSVKVTNNTELIDFLNRLVRDTPATYTIRPGAGSHAGIFCKVGDKEFPIFTSGLHGGQDRFSPALAKEIGETLGRLKAAAEAANQLKLIERDKRREIGDGSQARLTREEIFLRAQTAAPASRAVTAVATALRAGKKAVDAAKGVVKGSGKKEKKEKNP